MSSEELVLEPCYDCGGLNISRRLYRVDECIKRAEYICTCRDCDASWMEDEEIDECSDS